MKKKIVSLICLFVLLFGVYTVYNLKVNAVYYALNIGSNKKTENVIYSIIREKYYEDNEYAKSGLRNKREPHNIKIYNIDFYKNNTISQLGVNKKTGKFMNITYIYTYESNDTYYFITPNFDLYRSDKEDLYGDLIKVGDEEKSQVLENIKNLFAPIIADNSKEPFINLQWIFDWKYRERFN